ncbi:MAG: cation:proton antiporter subunit C [Eubacteriales bacterium]|nr:cation:proton antiporter subunit C [Eubacteriales bacterium]
MSFGEIGAIVIFFIGVYGVIARRNIMKTVVSLGIMDAAVILFFVAAGGKSSSSAPIGARIDAGAADAVPQALMITAIVIGIAVTAVSLTMFIYLYNKYGTTNWEKARKMRDNE